MGRLQKSKLVLALTLASTVVVTSAAAQTPAPSDPKANGAAPASGGDAPAHFARALELYQEQDYAGALVEFRRAHELAPSYKMLFNIGQVCYQLNDYACAMRSFETYLREGGSAVSSERKAEVEKEIAKLRARVGHLEIVTNVPGAEVSIDDVVVGKTPLAQSVVVSTGKRRVSATKEGYTPVSRIVEVAGTDSSRVELVFTAGNGAAIVPDKKYESRFNTITWIGLGVTAAFAATSAVTGVIALNADDDLKNQRFAAGQGPTQEMKDTQDKAQTFALVSDIALGLSVASLVGTVVYTLVHKPKEIKETEEKPAAAKAKVNVALTGTGAMLQGSF